MATAARAIKQTFPAIPVMMVEAGPKVTDSLQVPAEVDWVGFDWYCRPFSAIRSKLSVLEGVTAPHQRLFLLPEAAPLAECGGAPGHNTDADIARLQFDYLRLAEAHPRVVGLLAFGFWTSGFGSADLPLTVAAHREIAARVIRPPATPPPAQATPPPPPSRPGQLVRLRTRRAKLGPGGRLRIALACSGVAKRSCVGKIAIRTRRQRGRSRLLASGRFAIRSGRQRRVTLRIRRSLRVRVTRVARGPRGYRVLAVISTRAGSSRTPLTLAAVRAKEARRRLASARLADEPHPHWVTGSPDLHEADRLSGIRAPRHRRTGEPASPPRPASAVRTGDRATILPAGSHGDGVVRRVNEPLDESLP